jgi:hypothetical protein
MTRPELMEACYDQGLNMHSVLAYTSYSPVLERVAPGVWTARGQQLDPVELEAAKARLGQSSRPKARAGGWTSEGRPWFAFQLTKANIAGPVATVDPSIRAVVRSNSFPAHSVGGVDAGTVAFSDEGATAWGFTKARRILGAEPGDVLRVEVDLVEKQAIISVESIETFDSSSS